MSAFGSQILQEYTAESIVQDPASFKDKKINFGGHQYRGIKDGQIWPLARQVVFKRTFRCGTMTEEINITKCVEGARSDITHGNRAVVSSRTYISPWAKKVGMAVGGAIVTVGGFALLGMITKGKNRIPVSQGK